MGGARSSASVVKRLLANLRLPRCQRVHRAALIAPPGNTSATLPKKPVFEESQALLSSNIYFARPGELNAQGSHLHQNHLVSCFSTQSQLTRRKGPDIGLLDLALQKDWDHARNDHLGNFVIRPHSMRKVWWTCEKCPDGHPHSWSATVHNRSNGRNCPQCSGYKVCKHNSLATKAPKVAAQWDYEANNGTPDSVVAQSCQPVGWRCDACGHKWSAAPHARVSKQTSTGRPMCALFKKPTKHPTFAECNHPLLAEWDRERNAAQGKTPENVSLRSNKQMFWLCTKCPAGQVHSWSATPANRALYPDVAAKWHHSNNKGQPSNYTAGSEQPAWWFSPERGSWQEPIKAVLAREQRQAARLKRIQQRQLQSRAGILN
ncbi:hypothetical protein ABBQ38_008287 [Trebouxia sp. C0009 RCD-2024]